MAFNNEIFESLSKFCYKYTYIVIRNVLLSNIGINISPQKIHIGRALVHTVSQQLSLPQAPLGFLSDSVSTFSLPLRSLYDFDYPAGAPNLSYVRGKGQI